MKRFLEIVELVIITAMAVVCLARCGQQEIFYKEPVLYAYCTFVPICPTGQVPHQQGINTCGECY